MNSVLFDSVGDLLPHTGEMILISGVSSWQGNSACVFVDQDGSSVFADDKGNVPAWVGIEYMAQGIAAFAGIQEKLNNRPIRLGFLLGTRKYSSHVSNFRKGIRLDVQVERVFFDEGGISMFACEIFSGGQLMAAAEIKAIQPDNIDEIIK